MPRKPKVRPAELSAIPAELLEQFGSSPITVDVINAATLVPKKALIERAPGAEKNHHRRYPLGAERILTEDGPIRIEVPRNRDPAAQCSP